MILRPATFADEQLLLDWRNDPTVLAVSSVSIPVTPESHHYWLAKALHDNSVWVYIAEVDGVPVGQGRIERAWKAISPKMDSVVIGYSIAQQERRKGYGKQLAELLVRQAKGMGYQTVSCRIKRGNLCSVSVAMQAGVNAIEFF